MSRRAMLNYLPFTKPKTIERGAARPGGKKMSGDIIQDLKNDGQRKFELEIPLDMSFGDALNNLVGTFDELIQASAEWSGGDGLKTALVQEIEGWRGIFKKAAQVAGNDGALMVARVGEGESVGHILGLAKSGNEVMKHFQVTGELASDSLKLFFLLSAGGGPKMITDIGFGS